MISARRERRMVKTPRIPPVLVLGTGRCGSTMVSDILNAHPRVLSLSEFFSYVGVHRLFRARRSTGGRMWELYGRQSGHNRLMLREPSFEEFLYPAGEPGARFTLHDVPPIMCATLPHITDEYEALFDALEPVVRGQPKQPPVAHLRYLFGWLCERFGADVWVERSGASFLFASRLLRELPDTRVVHVYRDGRETAVSMSRHYLFRLIVAILKKVGSFGIDPVALMRRKRLWGVGSAWMESLLPVLVKYERLPFDRLALPDFAAFWSAQIELGHRMLGELPPERLLNLRYEDLQAEPEGQLLRLIRFIDPSLEDEGWIRRASTIPRPAPSKFAQLGRAEQAAITEACRPGLEILGYPHRLRGKDR